MSTVFSGAFDSLLCLNMKKIGAEIISSFTVYNSWNNDNSTGACLMKRMFPSFLKFKFV
jgi:hypothetical protein